MSWLVRPLGIRQLTAAAPLIIGVSFLLIPFSSVFCAANVSVGQIEIGDGRSSVGSNGLKVL
jgi:hypothetical protein